MNDNKYSILTYEVFFYKPCNGMNISNANTPNIDAKPTCCHTKYVTKIVSTGPIHK